MDIELTDGMMTMLCGAGAFVLILLFMLIFLLVSSSRMKKILKSNEFEKNDEEGNTDI